MPDSPLSRSSTYRDLIVLHDRIAVITINREEKLNALSGEVISQIDAVVRELAHNGSVRVIIITGTGKRAFAAGADIAELASITDVEHATALSAHGQTVFSGFAECCVPLIAAINGAALGGGLELALACDLRVAVPGAKLGLPEASLGLLPGFGGTQRLAELIGPSRAMRMLFTAQPITAQEALAVGLIDAIAEDGDALGSSVKLAETIAVHPRNAVAASKEALRTGLDVGIEAGLDRERELFGRALVGQEGRSGLAAFLARRSAS